MNSIMLLTLIILLLFKTPFIIVSELLNGKISHILENVVPSNSFSKYIPLVKQTSCITILEIPEEAFSLNKLPINIPKPINKIDIGIDTNIAKIIFILKSNPNITARIKINVLCITTIGISDIIYPIIYSIGLIGLTPNLINNDVVLSFDTNIAVKSVKNEKLKIITPGVKFINL